MICCLPFDHVCDLAVSVLMKCTMFSSNLIVLYCNFALPPYLRLTPITASRRHNVAGHFMGTVIATFVFTVRLLNRGRRRSQGLT